MAYINVGQVGATTKAALKKAVVETPDEVKFYGTSPMGPQLPGSLLAASELAGLAPGTKLTVVGPDPYNKRNWYATVEIGPQGRPVVK